MSVVMGLDQHRAQISAEWTPTTADNLSAYIGYDRSYLSISNIAGGIYVKMISSASGLIIGIIGYLAYRYLNSQIDKATNRMEVASADFIDILQEPTR